MNRAQSPRIHRISRWALVVCTVLVAGGCAGTSGSTSFARSGSARFAPSVARGLVLPSAELRENLANLGELPADEWAWEYDRNDHRLGNPASAIQMPVEYAEVREHSHLSTNNGRPRDYSRTTSRSVRYLQRP